VQFIFDDDGSTSIQYWMIKYGAPGASCPTPHAANLRRRLRLYRWLVPLHIGAFGYCAVNSPVAGASAVAPTALASVVLQGNAQVGTVSESVTATVAAPPPRRPAAIIFPTSEAIGTRLSSTCSAPATAALRTSDANTTLVVRVGVDTGVATGPGCDFDSYTAETNNLSIVSTAARRRTTATRR